MDHPPEDPGTSSGMDVLEISDSNEDEIDGDETSGATGVEHDAAEDKFETPPPALTIGDVLSRISKKKEGNEAKLTIFTLK